MAGIALLGIVIYAHSSRFHGSWTPLTCRKATLF
jgi:hypothetical protein